MNLRVLAARVRMPSASTSPAWRDLPSISKPHYALISPTTSGATRERALLLLLHQLSTMSIGDRLLVDLDLDLRCCPRPQVAPLRPARRPRRDAGTTLPAPAVRGRLPGRALLRGAEPGGSGGGNGGSWRRKRRRRRRRHPCLRAIPFLFFGCFCFCFLRRSPRRRRRRRRLPPRRAHRGREGKEAPATVLADTGASPLALLAPGQRHDCLLRHDVRCVGRHTLVAAASYTVPATGERRHLSQYFSFSAAAPLGVRTKVRPAPAEATAIDKSTKDNSSSSSPPLLSKPAVLVEATIDNARRGQCLALDPPRFEPSPGLEASLVSFDENENESSENAPSSSSSSSVPPPPPPPIPPSGAASFVWLVKPNADGDASSLAAAAASAAGLGRLDLRWRTPFGGAGRLQTQGIAPPPSASRRVAVVLAAVESSSAKAPLEKPFEVVLSVTSRVDAAVGPLRLEAAASSSPSSDAAPVPSSSTPASSLVLLGPPTVQVTSSPLKPRSSVRVSVTLLALQPGVQRLPPLRLVDGSDGSTLDVLSGWVMVSSSS